MCLCLRERVWRQHIVHFQEFYVPILLLFTLRYSFIHSFNHSFFHSLLNTGNVLSAVLGMSDTKMSKTGFFKRSSMSSYSKL